MGATTTYALPYPEASDVDNVPVDMKELADAVDALLAARLPVPSVGVYRNAPLSITGAPTLIDWDGERWETGTPADSMHSLATNPSRLVVPVAGVYLFTLSISQAIIAAVARATLAVGQLNGLPIFRAENNVVANQDGANGAYGLVASHVRRLAAGDYYSVSTYSGTPGPWDLSVGAAPSGGNTPTEATLTLLSR